MDEAASGVTVREAEERAYSRADADGVEAPELSRGGEERGGASFEVLGEVENQGQAG